MTSDTLIGYNRGLLSGYSVIEKLFYFAVARSPETLFAD